MIENLYILSVLLCLFGIISNKRIFILEILVLAIISYLMGRGALTLDTVNYNAMYYNARYADWYDSYEKGFLALQKFGWFLELEYTSFRIILTTISLLLIYYTLYKFNSRVLYVFLFYLVFAIFIDTVQIRNFFAFSIVIFGIKNLLYEEKGSKIKFTLAILLATSIHISSIIYILLLLIKNQNIKKIIKPIIFMTIVFCGIIFLMGNKVPLINAIMSSLEGGDRLQAYITGETRFGFLYPITLHLLNLFLVYQAYRIFINDKNRNYINNAVNQQINLREVLRVILWVNIITILFFPLYMYNVQFIRLSRNLVILNLLAFSLIQVPIYKLNYKVILFNIGVSISMFFWFYFTFIIQDHVEDIIIPFFNSEAI